MIRADIPNSTTVRVKLARRLCRKQSGRPVRVVWDTRVTRPSVGHAKIAGFCAAAGLLVGKSD